MWKGSLKKLLCTIRFSLLNENIFQRYYLDRDNSNTRMRVCFFIKDLCVKCASSKSKDSEVGVSPPGQASCWVMTKRRSTNWAIRWTTYLTMPHFPVWQTSIWLRTFLQAWYSEAALVSPAQCSVDQVWRGLDWGLVLWSEPIFPTGNFSKNVHTPCQP